MCHGMYQDTFKVPQDVEEKIQKSQDLISAQAAALHKLNQEDLHPPMAHSKEIAKKNEELLGQAKEFALTATASIEQIEKTLDDPILDSSLAIEETEEKLREIIDEARAVLTDSTIASNLEMLAQIEIATQDATAEAESLEKKLSAIKASVQEEALLIESLKDQLALEGIEHLEVFNSLENSLESIESLVKSLLPSPSEVS